MTMGTFKAGHAVYSNANITVTLKWQRPHVPFISKVLLNDRFRFLLIASFCFNFLFFNLNKPSDTKRILQENSTKKNHKLKYKTYKIFLKIWNESAGAMILYFPGRR